MPSSNKNKKSPKRTLNSGRKAGSTKKSAFEKGKVHISTYKVIFFCLCVIVVCVSLLLINNLKNDTVVSETEKIEKVEDFKKVEKNQQKTSENKKTDVKKSENNKNQVQKKSEISKSAASTEKPKQAEKSTETKNSPEKKASTSQKTTETKSQGKARNKENTADISRKITSEKLEEKSAKPDAKENIEKKPENSPENKENNSTQKKESEVKTSENKAPQTSTQKTADFPPAVNHAQLVFVFDDGGQNLSDIDKFLQLPFPVTVAVLPGIQHSVESAKRVRASGNELILHQPMQPLNSKINPGPGVITCDMDENQIISVLFQNIQEIGPVTGVNNHEGSAVTADAERMAVIMKTLNEEGIYFLDSRTNVETKVPYVAREMGYGYYERNIFLDNEKTRANVLSEIKKGLNIANKNGVVIMIGHVWSADFLPEILKEIYPQLVKEGYTFSTVSASSAKK